MMTINFKHIVKGRTINITATVCDGMVADYSVTANVAKCGVDREVLIGERGSAFDRVLIPEILKRSSADVEFAVDDEDDLLADE